MEEVLLQWFYSGKLGAVWLVAFVAGLLSFLSPCILPLVPAYMSYISGVGVEKLDSSKITQRSLRVAIFWRACLFVLGFSLVFVGMGLAFSSLVSVLHSPITNIIAGSIVVIFGAHFLGLWRFVLLDKSVHYDLRLRYKALEILAPFVLGISFALGWSPCTGHFLGLWRFVLLDKSVHYDLRLRYKALEILAPFVLGISFALGWSPCTGAIFGAITLFVGTGGYGVGLLIVYACGLAMPFLLVAIMLEKGFCLLARIKPFTRWIERVSGGILVVMGVLIMSGELGALSAWLVSY